MKCKRESESQVMMGRPLKIAVIGITDREPCFPDEVKQQIAAARYFAGGNRHRQLVASYLPPNEEWFPIVAPLENFFHTIRHNKGQWIVFASGDPLFFGIGNTLKREFPEAEFTFSPAFNSLQLLGHRFGINYGEFKTVSLTGRDWHAFDKALLQGEERLGILTDRERTPAAIAARMLEFGYANYQLFYGECLGGEKERVLELSLQQALTFDFHHPNCFFLEKTDEAVPQKGIPEQAFGILKDRPKMITKMPVRLATLAAMELHDKHVFWDIGACTGSISIEVRLHFPRLKVVAFEKRKESGEIILQNARKFRTPGIRLFTGDYLEAEKEDWERPDAVFLGGYDGRMEQILDDVNLWLSPGGMFVLNSVSEESRSRFLDWGKSHDYLIRSQQVLAVDKYNPITIIALKKKNRRS
ncbi:MAG: precorrin-6y C5,15-methyltransferase (decarboxylating) subunit CbiE [Mangrovibacterium sp.]